MGGSVNKPHTPEESPFWRPIDTTVYSQKLLKRGKHENTVLNVENFHFYLIKKALVEY